MTTSNALSKTGMHPSFFAHYQPFINALMAVSTTPWYLKGTYLLGPAQLLLLEGAIRMPPNLNMATPDPSINVVWLGSITTHTDHPFAWPVLSDPCILSQPHCMCLNFFCVRSSIAPTMHVNWKLVGACCAYNSVSNKQILPQLQENNPSSDSTFHNNAKKCANEYMGLQVPNLYIKKLPAITHFYYRHTAALQDFPIDTITSLV